MGHGLQGVLSDDEHPGEDLFAFSLSDKQDIHLSSNWVASNFELDPGATFAFQVDQLDEGGAGAPGGVQSDTTRHAIAINRPLPSSFAHAPWRSRRSAAVRVHAIGGDSPITEQKR